MRNRLMESLKSGGRFFLVFTTSIILLIVGLRESVQTNTNLQTVMLDDELLNVFSMGAGAMLAAFTMSYIGIELIIALSGEEDV